MRLVKCPPRYIINSEHCLLCIQSCERFPTSLGIYKVALVGSSVVYYCSGSISMTCCLHTPAWPSRQKYKAGLARLTSCEGYYFIAPTLQGKCFSSIVISFKLKLVFLNIPWNSHFQMAKVHLAWSDILYACLKKVINK